MITTTITEHTTGFTVGPAHSYDLIFSNDFTGTVGGVNFAFAAGGTLGFSASYEKYIGVVVTIASGSVILSSNN